MAKVKINTRYLEFNPNKYDLTPCFVGRGEEATVVAETRGIRLNLDRGLTRWMSFETYNRMLQAGQLVEV